MGSTNNLIPSRELQTQLERRATIVLRPAGTFLFRRGDEVSGVFLIRSGRISLALDMRLRSIAPGFLVPESSSDCRPPSLASLTA
jgi:CRP-like cAMP-binding protein